MKLLVLMILISFITACTSSPGISTDPLGLGTIIEQKQASHSKATKESIEAKIADKKVHLNLLQEQIFHELYNGHIQKLESDIFDLEAQRAELLHQPVKKTTL